MKKFCFIFLLVIARFTTALSQYNEEHRIDSLEIDSMKRILPLLTDTARINCLNSISKKYQTRNDYINWLDSIYLYTSRAYNEATQIGYRYGTATSLLSFAYYELDRNHDSSAEKYFQQTMLLGENLLDPGVIGRACLYWSEIILRKRNFDSNALETSPDNNALIKMYKNAIWYFEKGGDGMGAGEAAVWLGMTYTQLDEYEKAFEFCAKGMELTKAHAHKDNEYELYQWSLFNMSELYKAAGDYETALEYLRQCRQVVTEHNLTWEMEADMGNLFNLMGHYDSAFYYFSKFRRNPDRNSWSPFYYAGESVGLAETYFKTNEYDSALKILKQSINIFRNETRIRNMNTALIRPLILTGKIYTAKKNYATALEYEIQGLSLAQRYNIIPMLIDGNEALAAIYHGLEKNDSAYFYLQTYISLKDSFLNKQYLWRLDNKLNNFQRAAEETKKEAQVLLLNKDNQLKTQQLKQEALIRNGLIAGLFGLILIALFILRSILLNRKNEKLNREQLENEMKLQQLENEKKQAELQQQAAELEMQALRAQMNPHFIFNCLSSINRIILKNETQTASDYLTRFSRLIRMVLINSQKSLIPLEDELHMLRLYLDMERLRFKNSFDYGITFTNTIDEGAVFIPPLLLQPFCENAIWHGLMQREGQGHLHIELSTQNDTLHCIISDDGIGREKAAELKSKSAEKRKSMGLTITTQRLALLNRNKNIQTFYTIDDILDANKNITGTRVTLKIGSKEVAGVYH